MAGAFRKSERGGRGGIVRNVPVSVFPIAAVLGRGVRVSPSIGTPVGLKQQETAATIRLERER